MQIHILTLFPELFMTHFETSILKRARDAGLLNVSIHNIRHYAQGKHRVTDEPPYGGGGGMVLKPEPIFEAVESIIGLKTDADQVGHQIPFILLTPEGRLFNQSIAQELATVKRLLLICGRFEGVDVRVRQNLATDQVSSWVVRRFLLGILVLPLLIGLYPQDLFYLPENYFGLRGDEGGGLCG